MGLELLAEKISCAPDISPLAVPGLLGQPDAQGHPPGCLCLQEAYLVHSEPRGCGQVSPVLRETQQAPEEIWGIHGACL